MKSYFKSCTLIIMGIVAGYYLAYLSPISGLVIKNERGRIVGLGAVKTADGRLYQVKRKDIEDLVSYGFQQGHSGEKSSQKTNKKTRELNRDDLLLEWRPQ